MSETVTTWIPFAGFYNTMHEWELDEGTSFLASDDHGDASHFLVEMIRDDTDWRAVMLQYAKDYFKSFCYLTGQPDIKFNSLHSPREYNFENDKIKVDISVATLRQMLEVMGGVDSIRDIVKKALAPRSGFIPYYSNDVDDWGPVEEWEGAQVSLILEGWMRHQDVGENDVTEIVISDCAVSDMIYETLGSKGNRAVKLRDYLVYRIERGEEAARAFWP